MADYTRQISASTTMMIRDTGGWVEFWLKTGPSTWNNEQPWSYGANGSNSPLLHFRLLAGGNWQHFGSVHVSYNQTVRFTVYNSGLGFPTHDFEQAISRSTVPAPPTIWQYDTLSSSQIRISMWDGSNGGSAIVERQVGFGANPNGPEYYVNAPGGTVDVSSLGSGSRVYFWARTRNSLGWSGWSGRVEQTTWRVPDTPNPVTYLDVNQRAVRTQFNDRGNGGQPILERELGYGLNPAGATTVITSAGVDIIDLLEHGQRYYFWSRSRNSIGWSAWSERSEVLLIAGAKVYADGQWKRAVPYVKVDGEWKVARPWVRIAGIWKQTSI